MNARTLMIQGTASSVGKTLMVAALCRIFRARGLRVAPFKAQNMALNSFVTPDGLEIGRAQAVQAEAAGIAPAVEMNPILLKPERGMRSQVVLMGKPVGSMTFAEYHEDRPRMWQAIRDSLESLRERFDLIVIEGAGSPAEINLRSHDIVNMRIAELAEAPVILTGDIDRGGVFAQFVGTMELLEPAERHRVAALLINKFRGDRALLEPGIAFLETRLKIPVLGVVPYVERLRIADEDSVALDDRRGRTVPDGDIEIAVVRLPAISNYDDFLALEHESGVVVRFVQSAAELKTADLVIIPGSKSTIADLRWMRERGIGEALLARARAGRPVLGICGGCQMLGETIEDPARVESNEPVAEGLALLPLRTRFGREKLTAQVIARTGYAPSLLCAQSGVSITGYEIHMGAIERATDAPAAFEIVRRNGTPVSVHDGAIGADGPVVGTMLHGIFENQVVRDALLDNLRARRGLRRPAGNPIPERAAEYERLAQAVRENIDMPLLLRLAGLEDSVVRKSQAQKR